MGLDNRANEHSLYARTNVVFPVVICQCCNLYFYMHICDTHTHTIHAETDTWFSTEQTASSFAHTKSITHFSLLF